MDLFDLKQQFLEKFNTVSNLNDLDVLKSEFFGREKGKLTAVLRSLKNISENERKKTGKEANLLKTELQELLDKKRQDFIKTKNKEALKKEWFDITAPGEKILKGGLHPITKAIKEMTDIFERMDFTVAEGPEI